VRILNSDSRCGMQAAWWRDEMLRQALIRRRIMIGVMDALRSTAEQVQCQGNSEQQTLTVSVLTNCVVG